MKAGTTLGPGAALERDGAPRAEDVPPAEWDATTHPSSILRARDERSRHAAREQFTRELTGVAEALRNGEGSRARAAR